MWQAGVFKWEKFKSNLFFLDCDCVKTYVIQVQPWE